MSTTNSTARELFFTPKSDLIEMGAVCSSGIGAALKSKKPGHGNTALKVGIPIPALILLSPSFNINPFNLISFRRKASKMARSEGLHCSTSVKLKLERIVNSL